MKRLCRIFLFLAYLCLIVAVCYTIHDAAQAHANTPPPEKDWCRSYISGEPRPQSYCNNLN